MKKSILYPFSFSVLLFSQSIRAQQKYAPLSDHRSTAEAIELLEKDIPRLIKDADVPGMSAALIRNGKLVWRHHYGVINAETKEPVTDETIFEAASLSKPVTAYTALKLVDEGKLDLDIPLNKYLGNNYDVGDDERINLITARRVLTHTSGFPNWRPADSAKLSINFTPGEKFSYSGEGFVYLAKVLEHITAMKFEDLVKKTVFDPLGMKNSSFVWLEGYEKRKIYRHDLFGKVSIRGEGKGSNAAASLNTTAEDYAQFVIALLEDKGLKKKTWKEMLTPQVKVNEQSSPQVSWGLGIGLETTDEGKTFWHWGDQGDSKCYVTALIEQKDAIVYFTNSNNGLSFAKEVLDDAIGGKHPALAWLKYGRYNPAARIFFEAVIEKGAEAALKNYREQRVQNNGDSITEFYINTIGYKLLQLKKVDDAIAIFTQNSTDFPKSSNAWDSLAEAYMIKGNKELAIKYYGQSLALDPGNNNAVEQLKKLRTE